MTIIEKLVDVYKDCTSKDGLFSFEARTSFGKISYRVSMINNRATTSELIEEIYKCLSDNHPNYVIKSFEDNRMNDSENRHIIIQFTI